MVRTNIHGTNQLSRYCSSDVMNTVVPWQLYGMMFPVAAFTFVGLKQIRDRRPHQIATPAAAQAEANQNMVFARPFI